MTAKNTEQLYTIAKDDGTSLLDNMGFHSWSDWLCDTFTLAQAQEICRVWGYCDSAKIVPFGQ